MNSLWITGLSFAYLAILFAIAYFIERRSHTARSWVRSPWVYSLSLTVYCTAWTYYGSVGRAAAGGPEFLTTYLGPAITAPLWWLVLRKLIRVCKAQRITSIADFISSRYGKSSLLGVMVTIFCLLEGFPYMALQLKAIANSLHILANPDTSRTATPPFFGDSTFYMAGGLAVFTILFGTRKAEATEQHAGMVGAIAFEAIVKLLAFLAAGLFVTYLVFNGFGDIFEQAASQPDLRELFTLNPQTDYTHWFFTSLLSALAVLLLPRQFQVAVVENVDETHVRKAIWLFPLYLLITNLFVLPIAFGGKLLFSQTPVDADTYVLAIPLHFGQQLLALLVYIGGFSAASGMIIVSVIALSTMVSNNLVMPWVVRSRWFRQHFSNRFVQVLLYSRRLSICLILLLSYAYFKGIAEYYSLVSIGLVAFAAVAQFAPAVLGGLYWKQGNKTGAIAGISAGFLMWVYTLVLPSLVGAKWLPVSLMNDGLWGIGWLRPFALFGLEGLDYISHGAFWSLFFNTVLYVGCSVFFSQSALEKQQVEVFVDVFDRNKSFSKPKRQLTATLPDLRTLLARFLGETRTQEALDNFSRRHSLQPDMPAGARLVSYAERLLAGAIGTASARVVVASVAKEELAMEDVVDILKESQQLLSLNRELKKKSSELQKATQELQQANQQLQELDELKDEFLSTVTHELRTPVTAIRAFAEILHDNPGLTEAERQQFLHTILTETERMSRLITQVLDLEKYESGKQIIQCEAVSLKNLVQESVEAVSQLIREKSIRLEVYLPHALPILLADSDKLKQVLLNLLSNAIKFCETCIQIRMLAEENRLRLEVSDDGRGIQEEEKALIFNKFYQTRNQNHQKPMGSGLGLAISRKIVELHGGTLSVSSQPGEGATFRVELPLTEALVPN
jgi:signal transduction histidine kinase